MSKFLLVLAAFAFAGLGASAQQFDTTMNWPLCGRLYLTNPSATSCPANRTGSGSYNDFPISDPFGPRKRTSLGGACDFHRGLDIPAPVGTKVFAVAAGRLEKVEIDYDLINGVNRYDGISVVVKHFRPGRSTCGAYGQYFSRYHHLNTSMWNTTTGCNNFTDCGSVTISKGQQVGTVGISWSGFAHLHFEMRDAPTYDNCSGQWAGDAVNPLRLLPYTLPSPVSSTVSISNLSGLSAGSTNPVVQVDLTTNRFDFDFVKVTLRKGASDPSGPRQIIGTNQVPSIATAGSYNQNPNFYGIEVWNRQWSHRNNGAYPWSSFACGAANACPYCSSHGSSYDADLHLDQSCGDSANVCCFNGVRFDVAEFSNTTTTYGTGVRFTGLTKNVSDTVGCIEAEVKAANGGVIGTTQWGNC
mmetsp:Transcript_27772/g.60851  ORF Transcript_27772/g.60851 Transcript_27772/m.60851 type:complete len:414 (-) Transcript_27772:1041-2282(-)|eukprot:CAMPEP_0202901724 /NCGR_PEP_ID=MMETSP1392-20130828/14418_1 /ASSEMBLY_ACC=CAM_ASM_000868 /TAXON_ID=225041 /ORGANISM="Chlamydomonas chlamydogama, Strain SAG 11-48b" /LENGTH=413 /DNA_ID=CAMNT_0049588333 /DNA_START=178 /DNA_END=1419 /DNA_ORIENTATION=-